MSAKASFPCAVLMSLVVMGTAWCQYSPPTAPGAAPGSTTPTHTPDGFPVGEAEGGAPLSGPSSWIAYTRPGCCGPVGCNGPIEMELQVRSGISLPVAGGTLPNVLGPGWLFEGTGRSLFFNPSMDRAWAVDLGIGNVFNNGDQPNLTFLFEGNVVSVRMMNRTYVSLGGGREWWIRAPADSAGCNWRFGLDGGGRLGTTRLDFNDATQASGYRRNNDRLAAAYVGFHSDVEIPCGAATFLGGIRTEWDYTWMDILGNGLNGDIENVNFMLTLGVRY